MFERWDRFKRLVGTGLSFLTFGLGGLLLRLVYFPVLRLLVRDAESQARYARLAIHHAFRGFIGLMRVLGVLEYRIEGIERLQRPGLLILANHPTLIDVVFLISLVPNANCVVKGSLARNPFTRGPVTATGYITNSAGGTELVTDCIASLEAGDNLIIFPEGTRTPVGGEMKLQRGAANIAVRGGCNITPVVIRCEPLSLTKGQPWWKIPFRRVRFTIEVREDIPVEPFLDASQQEAALAARRLTDYLHGYFSKETFVYAGS
ncbi:MAG: lysophospholipid acyltransferase family protein [Pseudomonadota bacterium]